MAFIRVVDLNPKRAKLRLTVKLLAIFSPMVTLVLLLFHPVPQLSARSLWLYPLTFIVRWIYVMCGPTLWGHYLYKKLDPYIAGPPIAIAGLALLLWIVIYFKNRMEPQTVFLPVLLWLVSGGWTVWLLMALGK